MSTDTLQFCHQPCEWPLAEGGRARSRPVVSSSRVPLSLVIVPLPIRHPLQYCRHVVVCSLVVIVIIPPHFVVVGSFDFGRSSVPLSLSLSSLSSPHQPSAIRAVARSGGGWCCCLSQVVWSSSLLGPGSSSPVRRPVLHCRFTLFVVPVVVSSCRPCCPTFIVVRFHRSVFIDPVFIDPVFIVLVVELVLPVVVVITRTCPRKSSLLVVLSSFVHFVWVGGRWPSSCSFCRDLEAVGTVVGRNIGGTAV